MHVHLCRVSRVRFSRERLDRTSLERSIPVTHEIGRKLSKHSGKLQNRVCDSKKGFRGCRPGIPNEQFSFGSNTPESENIGAHVHIISLQFLQGCSVQAYHGAILFDLISNAEHRGYSRLRKTKGEELSKGECKLRSSRQ